jgi:hypothetical protein
VDGRVVSSDVVRGDRQHISEGTSNAP